MHHESAFQGINENGTKKPLDVGKFGTAYESQDDLLKLDILSKEF